ncbi:NUDIX hydrolase [Breoghania sp.]|uniref:NUDIX hydrolase n=1 Tax=Breoghania sp. TaxID=2065378 RepID=UPI002611F58E|nr:NUDIX hydrolase [Breoghania sp.]MDJ0930076.1 NUDIX hydrolase [Breoghania sp.]
MSDIRIEDRETLVDTPRVRTERLVLSKSGSSQQDAGGRTRVERIVHDHGSAISVLPYDPERGTILLTRQVRVPVHLNGDDARLVEACAGLIDEGEDAEHAVHREAMEEIGTRLVTLEKVEQVYTSPGFSTEKISLYLAPIALPIGSRTAADWRRKTRKSRCWNGLSGASEKCSRRARSSTPNC